MRALPSDLRRQLESAVVEGRRAAEAGVRAALASLGVKEREKPAHLNEGQARLRRGLRAKQRQLGGDFEVLVWDAAYEQWHRLLFARFLSDNGLLRHPQFGAPVTLEECEELTADLGEPDGWSVAARFAAEILPGIFRLDDPCLQLRLPPEHRLALEKILARLAREVFIADDSLGWVYQYWQSDRKDQVNASEVKVGGADLGPVTQLFTENYMVRFLLENSLGAWWAARHPDSPLVKGLEYLRFDDDGQPAAGRFEGWPDCIAEVTVMDPCCGSGHFLVEAFGMLWRMRAEEEGLDSIAAQDAVLRGNLFGLELDPRCVQIAMFAVALTAWKQGGGWRQLPMPNIACSGIPAKAPLTEWTALAGGDERLERALERLHTLFKDADTLGSLTDPRRAAESAYSARAQRSFDDVGYEEVAPLLQKAGERETADPAIAVLGADAAGIAHAANLLSRSYTLVATNVPYLSRQGQAPLLANYLTEHHPRARADLATAMMDRAEEIASTTSVVAPQNWEFLKSYARFRDHLLKNHRLAMSVRLGAGAFGSISGEVVKPVLTILTGGARRVRLADVSDHQNKAQALRMVALAAVDSVQLRELPGSAISATATAGVRLHEYGASYQGLITGDNDRYLRNHWEVSLNQHWEKVVSSPDRTAPYTARAQVLDWNREKRDAARGGSLARIQGHGSWGQPGIAISRVGTLAGTLTCGEIVIDKGATITPKNPDDLSALWAFVTSGEFEAEVRSLDAALAVSSGSLARVPIDVGRWRREAKERYPDGLPEPWSDDPTQWLFRGCPRETTEPLQVGVGRLVGYRWPEQPEDDELNDFADADGIVCLPAVGGEPPAANRLQAMLAGAYGDRWSPGLLRQLLEQTGSKRKSLTDWLLNDFFSHHCSTFSHRPFVWHIWDGHKDGFSALVNYHRLGRAGLEKLTYTYLGDWIERQRADAADDVAGADVRLAAARELKEKLEAILEGERPYDIYVRWKELYQQPIGWEPDLDDGVRRNIRPFVQAGVLRSRVNVHWKQDRGKNPDGSERHNDLHYTIAEKQQARQKARQA